MSFNPQRTVVIDHKVFISQRSSCRIIETGKAAKQKDIADFFETFIVWFEIDKLFQFGFREVATVFLDLFEFVFAERIFRHLAILETHGRNAFEYPHQFLGGVRVELILDFQVSLKIHHKIAIHLAKQDIAFPHLDLHKLFESPVSEVILIKGGLGEVDADKLFLSVVEFLEYGEQRVILDVGSKERIAHHSCRYHFISFAETVVMGYHLTFDAVEIAVELKSFFSLAFCSARFWIPDFSRHLAFEAKLHTLAINGNSDAERYLAIFFL
nr:hypothetical protein [Alistipes senegalensis]